MLPSMKLFTKSLVSRLVLSFLGVSLITVLIMGYLSYERARAALESAVYERINATLELKEDALNRWVDEKVDDLIFVKTQQRFHRSAELLLSGTDREGMSSAYSVLFGVFQTMFVNMQDFSEIALLSRPGGRVVVSSKLENEGDFRLSDTYFIQGLKGTCIQEVYLSPVTFQPIITVATPIRDETGRAIGVMAAHLDMDRMDEIILRRSGLGESGEAYLVDSTNTFVAGRGFGRADYPRGAHSPGIKKALMGESGEGLYLNYAGVPVVGAYRWIPERNLALLGEISQKEAFAPARRLVIQIVFIGALVCLFLALTVRLIAQRIAGPILAITDAAERITKGDRNVQAPVTTKDEVGELATAFNSMVKKIGETEGRFRTVFGGSPSAIVITRMSDNIITDVNEEYEKISGYSWEETVGKSAAELGLWKDAKKRNGILELVEKQGRVDNFQTEFRVREGTVKATLVSAATVLLNDERHLIFFVKDISKMKEVESALQENEEKYRLLADNVSDVLWVRDENLDPIYYSPSIEQLRGFTPEDVMRQSMEEIFVPDSREKALAAFKRQMMQEEKSRGTQARTVSLEVELYRKDGSTIWAEMNTRVMRTNEGAVTGIIGVTRDITRRKLAEQALKESEERYRVLFNSGSDAVFVFAIDNEGLPGKHYAVNDVACRMLDMSRDELMEMTLFDFMAQHDGARIKETLQTILNKKHVTFERSFVDSGGNEIPVEVNANLVELYDASIVIAFARDLTERKQAEEEQKKIQTKLIQANKMNSLGIMASGLAHEINNPNNTIMFNLRRFARTWDDIFPILEEYYDEHGDFNIGGVPYTELSRIFPRLISGTLESSEMIKAIIENLKGFIRHSADTMDFDVDINDVVRRAVSLLESQVRKGVGRLELDLADDLPRVRGNPQKLIQVVVNLVANALEALTDDDQRVVVTSTLLSAGSRIALTVTDQGRGMTEKEVNDSTQPFFTTKLESGGTGLGLTITRMLLDEHGASMDVDSTPEEGTTVTVTLKVKGIESVH